MNGLKILNSLKNNTICKLSCYSYFSLATLLILTQHTLGQNKKFKVFQNQIEVGFNYTKQFSNRDVVSGIGYLISTGNKYEQTDRLKWNYNRYFGYKVIFFEKHIIKLCYEDNGGDINPYIPTFVGFWGYYMYIKSIGYGYILPINKFNITIIGQLCNRTGVENVQFWNGNGNYLYNYKNATLDYNSYGSKLGIDFEYFFTKNFAIGANFSYYYLSNDEAKLTGDDIETINPNLIKIYKPISEFVNINVKLAYRFSLPKINFKKTL